MGRASDDSRDLASRERGRRDCASHLKDLRRWHETAPPDVAVRPTRSPVRLSVPAEFSGASSPAAWFEAF